MATTGFSLTPVNYVALQSNVAAISAFIVTGRMSVSLQSNVRVFGSVTAEPPVHTSWVYNLNTEAVSEYDNFKFRSMAVIGGKLFACAPTGLVVVGGVNDDSGAAIAAVGTLGTTDFHNDNLKIPAYNLKSVADVYSSGVSQAPIVITSKTEVVAASNTADRPMTQAGPSRTKLSKAVRSRYWQIGFANAAGSPFELDALSVKVQVLSRHVGP